MSASFLEVDALNVIIEAVKKAEDGTEHYRPALRGGTQSAHARLRFAFPIRAASEVNLIGGGSKPLTVRSDGVTLEFRPFEIKTVRITAG